MEKYFAKKKRREKHFYWKTHWKKIARNTSNFQHFISLHKNERFNRIIFKEFQNFSAINLD